MSPQADGTGALVDVSDRELLEVVNAARGSSEVIDLDRRPSGHQTSFPLEEVELRLSNGHRLSAILKDLSRASLTPEVRVAKPEFIHDPLREIFVYREVLARADLGTASCYAAASDEDGSRAWLLLERVEGRELYQVGALGPWRAAARWLARMHADLAAQGSTRGGNADRLLTVGADSYRHWVERALDFAGSRDERRALRPLVASSSSVEERLASLPATIIHGEFYASNVIAVGEEGERICPVDWEVAAVGPALIDLAALTTGRWTAGQRAMLEREYLESIPYPCLAPPGCDPLEALAVCRLYLAVQWLGWAPHSWTPPPDHRQNWLAIALGLVQDLRP